MYNNNQFAENMSADLRQFIIDAYESRRTMITLPKSTKNFPIQLDDQDDIDNINEFCNIFVTIKRSNRFKIELIGNFPITKEMIDLSEIYNGYADSTQGKLVLNLTTKQIEVLTDLADKIRKTSFLGPVINNQNWLPISARTISSLYRFVRIVKDFNQSRASKHKFFR